MSFRTSNQSLSGCCCSWSLIPSGSWSQIPVLTVCVLEPVLYMSYFLVFVSLFRLVKALTLIIFVSSFFQGRFLSFNIRDGHVGYALYIPISYLDCIATVLWRILGKLCLLLCLQLILVLQHWALLQTHLWEHLTGESREQDTVSLCRGMTSWCVRGVNTLLNGWGTIKTLFSESGGYDTYWLVRRVNIHVLFIESGYIFMSQGG